MTTKSINDRLGDGGLESVAVFSETESGGVDGLLSPVGSVIKIPTLVKQTYAAITRSSDNTTDTSFVTLASETIDGGLMNLNGELIVTQDWKVTQSTIVKHLSMDWGGQNVSAPTVSNTNVIRTNYRLAIKNLNSLSSQSIFGHTSFGEAWGNATAIINTANDVVIDHKCKWGTLAGVYVEGVSGEQITLLGYSIWYYPGST